MNEFPYPPTPDTPFSGDGVLHSGLSIAGQRSAANEAWALLDAGLRNAVSNSALLNISYLGAGRFCGLDSSLGAPVAGTGLTLRQPNGLLLVLGRVALVQNPEPAPYAVISGVLPNKPDGVEVFASLDESGALITRPQWQFDVFPATLSALQAVKGLLHLGRATTTGSAVTDFIASTREGFGIIRPRTTTGGGSSGGTGSGDTDTIGFGTTIPISEINPQVVKDYIDAQNALQTTLLRTEIQAGGGELIPSPFDVLADNIACVGAAAFELNPQGSLRPEMAIVGRNFGMGQFGSPVFSESTGAPEELPFDENTGFFGPLDA